MKVRQQILAKRYGLTETRCAVKIRKDTYGDRKIRLIDTERQTA